MVGGFFTCNYYQQEPVLVNWENQPRDSVYIIIAFHMQVIYPAVLFKALFIIHNYMFIFAVALTTS